VREKKNGWGTMRQGCGEGVDAAVCKFDIRQGPPYILSVNR
jgi:hypothetical protein